MGAFNSRPEPVVQLVNEEGENARVRYGVSTIRRKNMKGSAFAAVPNLDDHTSFFGVYDGDGVSGVEVALLCATQFHNELRDNPLYESDLYNAMKMTFSRMDHLLEVSDEWNKLLPRAPIGLICRLIRRTCIYAESFKKPSRYLPPLESGSTACVAAIRGYEIMIGNAGHSRCIISRNGQATELTTDHKPDNRNEKRRIESAGGQVTKDRIVELPGEAEGFLQQRGSGTARINGILTHSRGIGYFAFKNNKDLSYDQYMVTCDPEVIAMGITNDVEFLVIVSEGIWTFLTSQGVVDFIHSQLKARTTNLRTICRRLCDRCELAAYNVTAVLIQFIDAPPPKPEENLSADNVNSNDGSLPQASEENLSGGNGNNGDHVDHEQPGGREAQPLLAVPEITEEYFV